jgi:hypothetical protein
MLINKYQYLGVVRVIFNKILSKSTIVYPFYNYRQQYHSFAKYKGTGVH